MFLLESLCQGATMKHSLHLHPMVTPSLSALRDLDFLFQGCQWVHRSFRMLRSSSMPSGMVAFLSVSSGPEYAISSSAFLSSNVPDSELQGFCVPHSRRRNRWLRWLSLLCPTSCGRGSWSFPHHQDSPSRSSTRSRLPDVSIESSTVNSGFLAVSFLAASSIRHMSSSWQAAKSSQGF